MKTMFSAVVVLSAVVGMTSAFAPPFSASVAQTRSSPCSLCMATGRSDHEVEGTTGNARRVFLSTAASASAGAAAMLAATGTSALLRPLEPASALSFEPGGYEPKFDDVKVILALGITLDNLAASVSDESKWGKALDGLVSFNKEPEFYPGYALNYIKKTGQKNAGADPRVGMIRQACSLIGSCQALLEGREGMVGKAAGTEAAKRVKKAQQLIAEFMKGTGIEDERIDKYVATHA